MLAASRCSVGSAAVLLLLTDNQPNVFGPRNPVTAEDQRLLCEARLVGTDAIQAVGIERQRRRAIAVLLLGLEPGSWKWQAN